MNISFEFLSLFPGKGSKLTIDSNMALDALGLESCVINKGVYNISYSEAANGRAKLLISSKQVADVEGHRKRPSRRLF